MHELLEQQPSEIAASGRFFNTENNGHKIPSLFNEVGQTAIALVNRLRLDFPSGLHAVAQCSLDDGVLLDSEAVIESHDIVTIALNYEALWLPEKALWRLSWAKNSRRDEYDLRLASGMYVEKRIYNTQGRITNIEIEPNTRDVWQTIVSCLGSSDVQKRTRGFRKDSIEAKSSIKEDELLIQPSA